jgi:hypothetical protein
MPDVFVVTFAAVPGDAIPPDVRLRRLLKFALRATGLRCVGLATPNPPSCSGIEQSTGTGPECPTTHPGDRMTKDTNQPARTRGRRQNGSNASTD